MASKLETLLTHKGLLHEIPRERLALLQGEVMNLFLASPRHRDESLVEFTLSVLPAIHFNQFRVYRKDDQPIGWVSWAYMSDAEARGYMAGDFDFQVSTWIGGEHIWFIDFIAPFGHALKIADDLKKNVFPDDIAYAPDLEAEDGSKRVRKFFGGNVVGKDTDLSHEDFLIKVTG